MSKNPEAKDFIVEAIRSTLENAYIRGVLVSNKSKRVPVELSQDERDALLEPFERSLARDLDFIREAVFAARGEGIEQGQENVLTDTFQKISLEGNKP